MSGSEENVGIKLWPRHSLYETRVCYRLNFVSPHYSCVEDLNLNVTIFGDRTSETVLKVK